MNEWTTLVGGGEDIRDKSGEEQGTQGVKQKKKQGEIRIEKQ